MKEWRDYIIRHLRQYRYSILRRRLKNKNFSLMANNCLGAIFMHDIQQPFLTPMVNAGIVPSDFVKFLNDLDYYLSVDVKISQEESGDTWQFGYIDDIRILFMHFKYYDEPRVKWMERRNRINRDNMFIIMTERDDCTYEDLVAFDHLPYKNKVVFTVREYPEIKSAFHLKGCIDPKTGQLGYAYEYPHWWSLSRYMEQFDLIKWFNDSSHS
mgnify:FL=1